VVKVVGMDPGLAGTGIGVVSGSGRKIAHYAFGSIATDKTWELSQRLDRIYSKTLDFLAREKPDLVVVEDIFTIDRFPGSGVLLGKVSGVILVAASKAGARVEEIAVREAKKLVTGSGTADKHQVERAVRNLLDHQEAIRPFHASDALALAMAGYYRSFRIL